MIFLKKTLAVCMVGFGARCFIGVNPSCDWVGIWNWCDITYFGAGLAMQIKAK